ncbi:hypothetical protein [Shewanella aestuarii]|uniref:Uncharacterized protein n=1 Tax=Shewanella aestuarii TaxID=1028752 RepID=A0A6G9QG05_9GAMM|nr:hypothetical protein [Shewanella aestuarii]QIR13450.1 hypothetical protein HBH39_02175 [Shewanella aestuarii]
MRLTWITASLILASTAVQANNGLEQQLSLCAVKADKLDRLMCYDDLAANLKSTTSAIKAEAVTTPVMVSAPITATSVPAVTKNTTPATSPISSATQTKNIQSQNSSQAESFGLQKRVDEEVIEQLYYQVAEVDKDPYGALIVTLTNGHVWKQTGNERYKVKKGQTIFIKKGALSSFLLGSDDRNSTTRVKRVK